MRHHGLTMSKRFYFIIIILVIGLALVAAWLRYSIDSNATETIVIFLEVVVVAAGLGIFFFFVLRAIPRLRWRSAKQLGASTKAPRQVGCLLGVMWVVATALGAAIPGWVSLLLNQPSLVILIIPVAVTVTGLLQISILKRFGLIATSWLKAIFLGWAVGILAIIVSLMLSTALSAVGNIVLLGGIGLVTGLIIGWGQRMDVQTWGIRSRWWIVANGLGLAAAFVGAAFTLGLMENALVHSDMAHGDWGGLAVAGALAVSSFATLPLVIGTIYGGVSGAVLMWLLRHPAQHEQRHT